MRQKIIYYLKFKSSFSKIKFYYRYYLGIHFLFKRFKKNFEFLNFYVLNQYDIIKQSLLSFFYVTGYPSELFYRGASMWETLYGMLLAYPIVSYVFVPVYFSLGITSVYQYLDLRFKSRLVRSLASGTYIVRALLNQGVTVFTPCVALNTVIGIPYWASIAGITAFSIIFNLLVSSNFFLRECCSRSMSQFTRTVQQKQVQRIYFKYNFEKLGEFHIKIPFSPVPINFLLLCAKAFPKSYFSIRIKSNRHHFTNCFNGPNRRISRGDKTNDSYSANN